MIRILESRRLTLICQVALKINQLNFSAQLQKTSNPNIKSSPNLSPQISLSNPSNQNPNLPIPNSPNPIKPPTYNQVPIYITHPIDLYKQTQLMNSIYQQNQKLSYRINYLNDQNNFFKISINNIQKLNNNIHKDLDGNQNKIMNNGKKGNNGKGNGMMTPSNGLSKHDRNIFETNPQHGNIQQEANDEDINSLSLSTAQKRSQPFSLISNKIHLKNLQMKVGNSIRKTQKLKKIYQGSISALTKKAQQLQLQLNRYTRQAQYYSIQQQLISNIYKADFYLNLNKQWFELKKSSNYSNNSTRRSQRQQREKEQMEKQNDMDLQENFYDDILLDMEGGNGRGEHKNFIAGPISQKHIIQGKIGKNNKISGGRKNYSTNLQSGTILNNENSKQRLTKKYNTSIHTPSNETDKLSSYQNSKSTNSFNNAFQHTAGQKFEEKHQIKKQLEFNEKQNLFQHDEKQLKHNQNQYNKIIKRFFSGEQCKKNLMKSMMKNSCFSAFRSNSKNINRYNFTKTQKQTQKDFTKKPYQPTDMKSTLNSFNSKSFKRIPQSKNLKSTVQKVQQQYDGQNSTIQNPQPQTPPHMSQFQLFCLPQSLINYLIQQLKNQQVQQINKLESLRKQQKQQKKTNQKLISQIQKLFNEKIKLKEIIEEEFSQFLSNSVNPMNTITNINKTEQRGFSIGKNNSMNGKRLSSVSNNLVTRLAVAKQRNRSYINNGRKLLSTHSNKPNTIFNPKQIQKPSSTTKTTPFSLISIHQQKHQSNQLFLFNDYEKQLYESILKQDRLLEQQYKINQEYKQKIVDRNQQENKEIKVLEEEVNKCLEQVKEIKMKYRTICQNKGKVIGTGSNSSVGSG